MQLANTGKQLDDILDTSSHVESIPLAADVWKKLLSAPRKLKKEWNRLGLIVGERSKRGRRYSRELARQKRKLQRAARIAMLTTSTNSTYTALHNHID